MMKRVCTGVSSGWVFLLESPPTTTALLLLLLSVQHSASVLSPYILPNNTVQLVEFEKILCHTPNNLLSFSVKIYHTRCRFYKNFELTVNMSLKRNPELQDSTGSQWYEMYYSKYKQGFHVVITGNKTHRMFRRYPSARVCGDMPHTFTFPNAQIARYSKEKTFSTPSLPPDQVKTDYDWQIERAILISNIFKDNEEEEKEVPNKIRVMQWPYKNGGVRYRRYVDMETLLFVISGVIGSIFFILCCIYTPGKKLVACLKTKTLTSRIPEPDSSVVSVSETLQHVPQRHQHHQHQRQRRDSPPAYEDICQESPPPSFTEIGNILDVSLLQQQQQQTSPTRMEFITNEGRPRSTPPRRSPTTVLTIHTVS